MSFIVQISPFVHLFMLKIVFRGGSFTPHCPEPAVGLKPPDLLPQVVPTLHFIPSIRPGRRSKVSQAIVIAIQDFFSPNKSGSDERVMQSG